jgi:hypothetical protein
MKNDTKKWPAGFQFPSAQVSTFMQLAVPEPVPLAIGAMSRALAAQGLVYGSVCSGIEIREVAA